MKFLPALAAFLICSTGKTPSAAVPGKVLPDNPPAAGEPLGADAPLDFKKGTASLASMRADELKWFGTWLLPELSRTWEGEPWKDRAVAFVKERLHRFQYNFPSENTASPMVEQASLLNFGCRDPWVRLLGAWELESQNAEEDYAKMWQAFTEIRDSPTDPALKRFAALPLLMEEKDLPRAGEWPERLARAPDASEGAPQTQFRP
ncbi:MAG: hypothetical protein JWL81_745 [Verrucomicrobiales bacterium]|nr:hypothetical protein [Verrucomicrobiales bacterium]